VPTLNIHTPVHMQSKAGRIFLLMKCLYTLPQKFLIEYSCKQPHTISILNHSPWSFRIMVILSNIFLLVRIRSLVTGSKQYVKVSYVLCYLLVKIPLQCDDNLKSSVIPAVLVSLCTGLSVSMHWVALCSTIARYYI